MVKQIKTLSIEEDVWNNYSIVCKDKGIVMSKQIAKFLEDDIKNIKKFNSKQK